METEFTIFNLQPKICFLATDYSFKKPSVAATVDTGGIGSLWIVVDVKQGVF